MHKPVLSYNTYRQQYNAANDYYFSAKVSLRNTKLPRTRLEKYNVHICLRSCDRPVACGSTVRACCLAQKAQRPYICCGSAKCVDSPIQENQPTYLPALLL
jgi:hypothetical protein